MLRESGASSMPPLTGSIIAVSEVPDHPRHCATAHKAGDDIAIRGQRKN
jgi:hypothetical protein